MRWQRLLIVVLALALLFGGGFLVMRKLTVKEALNRSKLLESAREALDELREDLAAEGIETYVGQTLRTPTEQEAAVLRGSSTTATTSWHLLGRAVDLYPYNPATGEPDLDGVTWDTGFRRMHELAQRHGFRGLAFNPDGSKRFLTRSNGSKFWDGGHLEFTGGMTFAQAKERYNASGGIA